MGTVYSELGIPWNSLKDPWLRPLRTNDVRVRRMPACHSAYEGDLRRLHQLLKNDPKSINAQEASNGDTPLIVAYRRGNARLVQYLLDNNADVSIRNKKKRTVLHYAAKRTFTFLDYLMIIILMPILLIGFFIMEDKRRKNMNLLKLVLSSEVDVNAVDYKGNTALHYVCQRKSEKLLPLLLEKNPDTDIKNNCGETALDVATRLKFNKIVYMLRKTH